MWMYDFDGSVYAGRPLLDFYRFCLWRRPRLCLCLPRLVGLFFACCFGSHPWTRYWEAVYRAPCRLAKLTELTRCFWTDKRLQRLRLPASALDWAARGELFLLSGAPDYLLAAAQLPGCVLCAGYDQRGVFCPNREGEERLHRLREETQASFCFYGTRLKDHVLAIAAQERYCLRGGKREAWDDFVVRQGRRWGFLQQWISPEFFRFWCVGWLNMAAAWLLEAFWGSLLPENLGFSVGYGMSLLVSFVLNSKLTFRRRLSLGRLGAYILSYVPNFIVQFATVFLLNGLLGLPYLLCCFLAAVVGTPVTFLCLKLFAFRQSGD